jgi:MoaA/NifB/PqqE/SkfB family radical SAM enzyme
VPASGCADNTPDARASGPTRRILQLHPTLRCNLECAHCYSSSGPAVRVELDLGSVCAAVSDARELGFDVLSVSGGEPFVYRWLPELLTHARNRGMQTTVTSNGTVLTDARLDRVDGLIDGMALSVDGPPDLHDELRRSAGSFNRLCDGLTRVRERGIPFGIIHTLTERSWRHLPWVAAFAANHGAALLQVHPLELTGRAATQLGSGDPRADTLGRAYLLCKALEGRYAPDLAIQLDVLLRRDIIADPELVYAQPGGDEIPGRLPADRLGSLVLEADGTLVPVSYGFGRSYALGNIRRQSLHACWSSWESSGYERFRTLCRSVYEEIAGSDARLVNWHDIVVARSAVEPMRVLVGA